MSVCALTTKVTMLVFITNTPRRPMRSIWRYFQILIGVQTSNIGSQSAQAMYVVVQHLFFSSSRTQKLISLSSGEAEVYAASSAAWDGILIGRLIHFATGQTVLIHHLMGSSAARGVLARQGVGRIRHISCRVLWLQQLVELKGSLEDAISNQSDTCHVV